MGDDSYLAAAEVAGRLGISLRTVRRRIADGTLPSVRIGGAVRVPVSALELPSVRIGGAVREAVAAYGVGSDAEYIAGWNKAHWPDTYARMLERRRRAFETLDRLRKLTKPPSGPDDTVDAMLAEEPREFGARLLKFIPPAPGEDE